MPDREYVTKDGTHVSEYGAQMPMAAETARKCRECEVDISHRYFNAKLCEPCANQRVRARHKRYREANREKRMAEARQWREGNSDHVKARAHAWRAANPEYAAKWRARNREKLRERFKQWFNANPDKMRECSRRWNANNPEKARENNHRRRARKKGQCGKVSPGIEAVLMERQKGLCVAPGCGAKLAKIGHHLDHIVPLAKGGEHDDGNLQLLCPQCNLRKHALLPEEFARRRGFLI